MPRYSPQLNFQFPESLFLKFYDYLDFDFHDDPRHKEDIPAATEYNIRISISCLSSDGLFIFSDIDLKTIINKSRDWVFRN